MSEEKGKISSTCADSWFSLIVGVWLHTGTAIIAAYFGYGPLTLMTRSQVARRVSEIERNGSLKKNS